MTVTLPPDYVYLWAAKYRLAQQAARRIGLLDFTRRLFPEYVAAPHHELIAAHLEAVDRGDLDRRIRAMLEMHERRQSVRPHLVVRDQERYLLVPTSEVHCLEATGNYVRLHCEHGSHLLRSTLPAVEATRI